MTLVTRQRQRLLGQIVHKQVFMKDKVQSTVLLGTHNAAEQSKHNNTMNIPVTVVSR